MNITLEPTTLTIVSQQRQREITERINAVLARDPMQGFLFLGPPNTGKTTWMNRIHRATLDRQNQRPAERPNVLVHEPVTLAEWIRQTREWNCGRSRRAPVAAHDVRNLWKKRDCERHLFFDEIDTQPNYSHFSLSNLQEMINAVYECRERVRLVAAMNKSWNEFAGSVGEHVARRIEACCIKVDLFNTGRKEVA